MSYIYLVEGDNVYSSRSENHSWPVTTDSHTRGRCEGRKFSVCGDD